MMRILVLGATGRTGKLLLQQALEKGYDVNVLVRDKSKLLSHPNLTVFQGLSSDLKTLADAIKDCNAILSALNISRNSDFPWSKLRTPTNFLSKTAENIIRVTKNTSLNRVIVTSAWGVGNTWKDIPWWFKWLINNSNIGSAYADHERQEKILEASTLHFTAIRPVGLTNSLKNRGVIISFNNIPKPKYTLTRKSVASFMISALKDGTYIRQFPVLSNL